ncbi:uncharacterized protein [Littorina saxatilis]|uniref:uncharacterized protein n=1 Tax=Littorina saxatilis TaxID=31220 RepID=UPI0038B4E80A
MKLMWGILCLFCVFVEVTSDCPTLANTNGIMTAKITWTYDFWSPSCTVTVSGNTTYSFSQGESKSLPEVGNDCIKFKCDRDRSTLRLDSEASSCAYGSSCSSEVKTGGSCSEKYTCYTALYDVIPAYTYTNFNRYRHGWFAFFSGYTCGNVGSGHCSGDQCFNPHADPRSDAADVKHCVDKGASWTRDSKVYTCQEKNTCASDTYVELTLSQTGCDNKGSFVPEGTVTWSDPCYHTVCVVEDEGTAGKLVTSFKDGEGCVYQDQCVGVGDTTAGEVGYTCANLTCRKDTSRQDPFHFDVAQTGCLHDGKCYKEGKKVDTDGECDQLVCKVSTSEGTYYWDRKFTGCYKPGGEECTHKNNKVYWEGDCIRVKCQARTLGKWQTWHKNIGSCVPSDAECTCKKGIPGCKHKGKCHPVKTVIRMDNCTQYVCHSDDAGLNNGTYTDGTPLPQWEARATGCYGPTGCMKLGEQYVDPNTLNAYRCDYNLAGWGTKLAVFHQACVAPNGEKLKVGDSAKVGSIWYSCYQWGKIRNPIDTSIVHVPEDHNQTCGFNPDTGKVLFKKEFFYRPYGRCIKRGYHCDEVCQFFDQPCRDTDLTPYRHIGDKFIRDGARCLCTQDMDINNRGGIGTFYKPSLCSQQGVTDAACKDPTDSSLHQWGEIWERSGSDPLEVCTCHPLTRQAYCSDYLPDVNKVFDDMKI